MSGTWQTAGGIGYVDAMLYPLADMNTVYQSMAPLRPHFWRAICYWSYVAKARDPGAAVASPPSYGTAPHVFTPPTTANRDWSHVDRYINEIIRIVDVDPILIIGGGRPKFRATSGGGFFNLGAMVAQLAGQSGSTSAITPADYGNFCAEVAARYKPGGPGIAPDLAGKGVTHFEIWNEENSSGFWGKSVDPAGYTAYLQAAYNAIKAVPGLSGSASTVIFGGTQHIHRGTASILDGWMTMAELEFVTDCYAAGAQGYFDWMACHPYTTQDDHASGLAPDPADDAWVQFDAIRALMLAQGDDKPVLISELGYPVSMCTEQQQADYTQTAMSYWAARPWVVGYILYNARDSGKQNTRNDTLGILRWDKTPRLPLYNLLASMASPEATLALNVGALTLGMTQAHPVPLTVGTLAIGMAATVHMAATLAINVGTLAAGFAAVDVEAAALALNVGTLSLGMSGLVFGASALGLSVGTLAVGMAAMPAVNLPINVGTLAVGMAAVDREAAALPINVGTLGVGMSGAGPSTLAINVGTLGVGMSAKLSVDFTFSGTTKPSGLLDVSSQIASPGTDDLAATAVTSGVLQEGSTITSVNGTYYMVTLWPDPTITNLQDVKMTVGNLSTNQAGRGQGCACAFDSAGTNGVFAIAVGGSGGSFGEAIFTKVGNTITQQASQSTGLVTSADVFEIAMSVSAGVYTYTLLKNGVATGLSWTDSTHIITPGKYWGGAFQHTRVTGVQGPSRGLSHYHGADV